MGLCASTQDNKKSGAASDGWLKQQYKMGKTLGKGGSCRVVVAIGQQGPELNQKYALKIMSKREKLNQDLFNKEVSLLSKLKHPNIIRLHKHEQDANHFYIFTELCEGGELFDRIVDKNNPITEKRASELVYTMLEAIQYCHQQNIVHRDLKPENFVFKTKDLDSEMVLIDFGCAKIVEDETEYKDLVGTPYYLAPESAAGHKYVRTGAVLKASDVWSIGVIAYVLMTGRPPFNGRSNNEIFSAIIKKKIKFPSGVKLSDSFKEFVKKMLKKSPKQRITLEAALKMPWVLGKGTSTNAISGEVLTVLRQFNHQSKLKKAITKTVANHMGEEPKEKIRAHFERLDKDNNKELDADELAILLQDMGISLAESKKEAQKIIDNTDDNKDGTICFEEFATIWQRKLLSVNESYVHAVFSVLDENGDGTIDASELAKVLDLKFEYGDADDDPNLAQKIADNKKYIDELIKEVDSDGDGVINFEEFKKAMSEAELPTSAVGQGKVNEKELLSNVDNLGDHDIDAMDDS